MLYVASEMVKVPGLAYAMTRTSLLVGRINESPIQNKNIELAYGEGDGHKYINNYDFKKVTYLCPSPIVLKGDHSAGM